LSKKTGTPVPKEKAIAKNAANEKAEEPAVARSNVAVRLWRLAPASVALAVAIVGAVVVWLVLK